MVYVDTSILVAYYCPEPISDAVEEIIRDLKRPVISRLTEVELISAISRKIRENNLTPSDGSRIVTQFHSHIKNAMFRQLAVDDQHYQIAINWISRFSTPLRTLDALHLAIAAFNNLPLITADVQLSNAARHFGVEVNTISEKLD
jgi:predicted nucleic acid-binding protein